MATTAPVKKTTTLVNGIPHTTTQPVAQAVPITPITAPVATTPALTATPAIPLSTLQAPVPQAATVVQPAIPTAAVGFQGYTSSLADSNQQNLNQNAANSQATYTGSLDSYLRSVLSAPTESGLESQYYSKNGVDTAESEYNDISNQLTAEQVSTRHRIEKLQANNVEGRGAEAIQAQIDQINKDSISKQADLAVTQLAAQGKYQLAKQVADRAIDGILEADKNKQSALQLMFQVNKDLYDKNDQRAFEAAQADRNTKLQNEEYRLRSQFDQKLKQSDPLYQAQLQGAYLSNQKDALALQSVAGTNAGSALSSQAPYAKLGTAQQQKADAYNNIVNQLKDYRDTYTSLVTDKAGSKLVGSDASLLKSKYNAAIFALAQAVGTGALQEADRKVISNIIPDPTDGGFLGIGGPLSRAFKGGKAGGVAALDGQIGQFTANLNGFGLKPTNTGYDPNSLEDYDLGEINSLFSGSRNGTTLTPSTYF